LLRTTCAIPTPSSRPANQRYECRLGIPRVAPTEEGMSEPGFSGLQDLQDKRVVFQCSDAKDRPSSFETQHIHTNS